MKSLKYVQKVRTHESVILPVFGDKPSCHDGSLRQRQARRSMHSDLDVKYDRHNAEARISPIHKCLKRLFDSQSFCERKLNRSIVVNSIEQLFIPFKFILSAKKNSAKTTFSKTAVQSVMNSSCIETNDWGVFSLSIACCVLTIRDERQKSKSIDNSVVYVASITITTERTTQTNVAEWI